MTDESLMRLPAVLEATALGRSTLYQLIRDGKFPAPIQLGARSVAWPRSQVQAFVAAKIQAGPRIARNVRDTVA